MVDSNKVEGVIYPSTAKEIKERMAQINTSETVSKRNAAREVWGWLKMGKTLTLVGVGFAWIVALTSAFSPIVGAVFAAVSSALFVFALFKVQKEMQRLEFKYSLDSKSGA